MKLLLVYGTTEGHTRTITEHMADIATANGAMVDTVDSADLLQPLTKSQWDAIVVGGSVHQGHHQMSLRAFILNNLTLLQHLPSAFFSVSLSAAVKDDAHREEARSYLTNFLQDLGWQPALTACFAGAIKHSEYDYFRRMVLSLLARQLEPGIVQPHDIVYTDWTQVETFVKAFLERSKQLLAVHR
jgi:menaquinone-dependent protoporphyrinogen oxidase